MYKLMNRLLNKLGLKRMMCKAMRTVSWAVGVSLIISLLLGGVTAYGVPYKGLDMPICIHSNEEINWSESLKEDDKSIVIKDLLRIRDKMFIFKAVLVYLGQGARIGRGPPMDKNNSQLDWS